MKNTTPLFLLFFFLGRAMFAQTWELQPSGFSKALHGVSFVNTATGYIACDSGMVLRTTDGGKHWKRMPTGVTTQLNSIDFVNDSSGIVVGTGGVVRTTSDSGKTWTPRTSGTTDEIYKVKFLSASIGFALQRGTTTGTPAPQLLKSVDSGKTWLKFSTLATYFPEDFYFTSPYNFYVAGTPVLHSTDGGATFLSTNSTGDNYTAAFIDSLTGCTAGAEGLLSRTTNGGLAWQPVYTDGAQKSFNRMRFISPLEGWCVGSNEIIHSTDAGINWTVEHTGSPQNSNYYDLSFATSNQGWVVGNFGEIVHYNNGDSVLPVTLTSFTATHGKSGVALFWNTASEENTLGFELLRNGEKIASYETDASLRGSGTSSAVHSYSFIDRDVTPSHLYRYTLVEVSTAGERVEIAERTVSLTSRHSQAFTIIGAYPNPSHDRSALTIESHDESDALLTITDYLGRSVARTTEHLYPGINTVALNGSSLPSGVYSCSIACQEERKMVLLTLSK